MKTTILILAGVMLIIFTSCWSDSVRGKGPVVKINRNPGKFKSIELDCNADVYLSQADVFSCIIETQENIQPLILTNIDDETLRFYTDKSISTDKLIIYITAPDYKNIKIDGSGDVFGKNTLNVKELNLRISGSGNIVIDKVITDDLTANIDGSGEIKFATGKADNASYQIEGSGKIIADKIEAEDVEATIEGSGNIHCYAGDNLEAKIKGSGNVKYKGAPKTKFTVEGSGNVSSY